MADDMKTTIECEIIGEYLDDAAASDRPAFHRSEVVQPEIVAEFVEHWEPTTTVKEFTILLKDGSVASVNGHYLKHQPHAIPGEDTYSVVVHTGGEEVLVALFKSAAVAGIFHGKMIRSTQSV